MRDLLPAAILAGGLATRLRPLTETLPKSLVPINGSPFIFHQLHLLRTRGIKRVVLCTGHLGTMIEELVGDGRNWGVSVQYSPDGPEPLGTAGALRNALPLLGDAFFVLYGDSYLTCDYAAVQDFFLSSPKAGLMTVFRNEGRWDSSNVEFGDGKVIAYDKLNRTPRMQHIDYGLGVFRRGVFENLPSGPHDLAVVYQKLAMCDALAAFEVNERFYETGSFAGIQELAELLAGADSPA